MSRLLTNRWLIPSFVKNVGVAGNTSRDQHIGYTTSTLARFVGVNTRTTTGSARDYIYNYYGSSSLLGGYTMGSFSVIRGYESQRDVLTSLDSRWSGSSYTRYDYTSNALGQRVTAKQSQQRRPGDGRRHGERRLPRRGGRTGSGFVICS